MLLFLLFPYIQAQTLSHQVMRPSKFNYDLASERLDCKFNKEIFSICKSCKASHAYLLDEQNWLIVGVYHQFGIKSLSNKYKNYFNLDQYMLLSILITFAFQQQEGKSLLKHYLETFTYYYYLNHFIHCKNVFQFNYQIVNTTLSQIDLKYNSTNNFSVLNFMYNGLAVVDTLLSQQNLMIKNQNLVLEKRGKFNSSNNNQQISLTQNFNGENATFEELSIDFMPPLENYFKFVIENYSPFYGSMMGEFGQNKTKIKAIISKELKPKQKIYKLMVQE